MTAHGPSQIWSWDITKLQGPVKGTYFNLYVMVDIFSRKAVHHRIEARESDTLAKEFITDAVVANDGLIPHGIHADRGTSMSSYSPWPSLHISCFDVGANISNKKNGKFSESISGQRVISGQVQ